MVEAKIRVDVVCCSWLRRATAIVPEIWEAAEIIGKNVDMAQALSTTATIRSQMAYFEHRTVKLSSAPMVYNSEVFVLSGSASYGTADFYTSAIEVDESLEMVRHTRGSGVVIPVTNEDVASHAEDIRQHRIAISIVVAASITQQSRQRGSF